MTRTELAQRHLAALYEDSGIPLIYRRATIDDFGPAVRALHDAALRDGKGLFIYGPVSVGKSHLAAAVLRDRLGNGGTGLFVKVPNLLDAIKATFHGKAGPTEDDLLKAVVRTDCLVLDDIGVEGDTDWVRQKLFQIVDGRYVEQREMVLTSNDEPDTLASPTRLGERTVSRLMGCCQPILLHGEDRRVRGK